jgi:methylthioribose-1-phosphate isomerase
LVAAHKKIKNFEVRNTETRPLYQWRKTSIDLLEDGIKTTMVTDDSAPYFIDKTVDKNVEIDMVIIWCDALKLNGNAVNKVGSFSISLSAKVSKIPLYIIWNLTKVDAENKVKIETRPGSELRPDAPKELTIVNYAFDTVPSKNITWIVTEFGIIKPRDIKKYTKKYYPWMYK